MLLRTNRFKIASIVVVAMLSFVVQADIVKLSGMLKAANQNGSDPAQVSDPLGIVPTDASGSIEIMLDTDNNTLGFKLDVEGISPDQLRDFGPNGTPIHLHLAGGDNPGNFGPIAIDLSLNAVDSDLVETTEGFQFARENVSILLDDQGGVQLGMHPGNGQIVDALLSGDAFVLVHTNRDIFSNDNGPVPGFPFGEIRANLTAAPSKGMMDPAHGMDIIILEDASDVASAVAEIKATLEQQGFEIPLIIDHAGAAASVELDLTPNQVIFARPPRYLEKRLLRKSHTIGIDLPLKFLFFEDKGVIKLSVNTLGYLIDRHNLSTNDFVLRFTDKFINQFGTSGDQDQGLVTIESSQSVDDTVLALQDAISANPAARIPLVLNYGERNRSRHRKRSPVLVVFGNPNVGTPLMQADPRIGIDLPLKFLIWQDRRGQVKITYNDPHSLAGRINLTNVNDRLAAIANALSNIAQLGAGGDL